MPDRYEPRSLDWLFVTVEGRRSKPAAFAPTMKGCQQKVNKGRWARDVKARDRDEIMCTVLYKQFMYTISELLAGNVCATDAFKQ